MDGKRYYELGGRTQESAMISAMIQNDGGKGQWTGVSVPNNLTYLETLLENKVDFLWAFLNHEGIHATRAGHELNVFDFNDYNVPYGFSPIIAADPRFIATNPHLVASFLSATERGFQYAAEHPKEAAQMMLDLVNGKDCLHSPLTEPLDLEMVAQSCEYMKTRVLDVDGRWGKMEKKEWTDLVDWLGQQDLLNTKTSEKDSNWETVERQSVNVDDMFTRII
ncbi:hypothetical protein HDU98_007905 [Podochytrium sp. JEL0797]|nr:hypothetical protein HDU98_007905 [Podochytrium sp. JEL0797]